MSSDEEVRADAKVDGMINPEAIGEGTVERKDPPPPEVRNLAPQPVPGEPFCINVPDLKQSIPIREASNEVLAKHLQIARAQHTHFMQLTMHNMQQSSLLAQACAAIAYEQDRRLKAFAIVTDLPANLNVRDIRRTR